MGVLTFEQAFEVVQQYRRKVIPVAQEAVPLSEVLGRVLAQPVFADRDFPPFPRSARDGYALQSADLNTLPSFLRVIGQVKAGARFDGAIASGQTVQIMTGAPAPEGADAVVMVEYTKRTGDQVEVSSAVAAGANIVQQASEGRKGQELLPLGMQMGFAQVAVAAAVGKTELSVYKKPRVAILATGDELVDVAATPAAHQIRNSNTYSLAAQTSASGGAPVHLPVAPDEKAVLEALIREGLSADLLLLSGGVSMGEFDLVEEVFQELGAEFFFTGVYIQPGKPVVFGKVGATAFFGLPGNPLSTMVTFDLFVRPVLQALAGSLPVRLPAAKARLAKEIRIKTGLTRFLPAVLSGGLYDSQVEAIPWQGSGDIAASARANCYVVVPPDRDLMAAGEMISVLLR